MGKGPVFWPFFIAKAGIGPRRAFPQPALTFLARLWLLCPLTRNPSPSFHTP